MNPIHRFGVKLGILNHAAGVRLAYHVRRRNLASIYDSASTWHEGWYFELRLKEETSRSKRFEQPFAIIVMKVSGLGGALSPRRSEFNNRLASIASSKLRSIDIPAVIGDGQYAVCLPATGHEGAKIVGERLAEFLADYEPLIGFAAYPTEGQTGEELLRAAEERTRSL